MSVGVSSKGDSASEAGEVNACKEPKVGCKEEPPKEENKDEECGASVELFEFKDETAGCDH